VEGKSKTVSIRLPSSSIEELKHEAEIEKINFNSLILKILGKIIKGSGKLIQEMQL